MRHRIEDNVQHSCVGLPIRGRWLGGLVTALLMWVVLFPHQAHAQTGRTASYGGTSGAYFGIAGGPVFLHARRFEIKTDGSQTWLNYAQPGGQIEFKYGGSLTPNWQVEMGLRARYVGYGSVAVINPPGFSNQILVNNQTGGFYAGGALGINVVYSFFERNRDTPGQSPSGPYVMLGLGASLGYQSVLKVTPQLLSNNSLGVLDVAAAPGGFFAAPFISAGVGYEYVSGWMKLNIFYTFDAEFSFDSIDYTVMIHSVNIGLRF